MAKIKKYLIGTLVVVAVVLAVFLIFKNQFLKFYTEVYNLSQPEGIGDLLLKQIEKKIFTPGPLRVAEENASQPFSTRSGVVKWTNEQRQQNGLAPLKENLKLVASAKLKVEDMFKNQYFEHVSPIGVGVDGLAQKAGYEYILIGENLAMGNFQNSEKVVEAWMDSPGHRENILNGKYQEIGVAVLEGIYDGKKIWMAVQHFGLPMSYCEEPNENLKAEIEANESQMMQIKDYLDQLRVEIEAMKPRTREEMDLYNAKVDEYNSSLDQYNLFVEELKNLIANYNSQVNLFNQCLMQI